MQFIYFVSYFLTLAISSDYLNGQQVADIVSREPHSAILFLKKDCSECSELETMFNKLEKVYKGYIGIGIADSSVGSSKYKVSKFPAVLIFDGDDSKLYKEPITHESLFPYLNSLIQKNIQKRFKKEGFVERDTFVITLDESNFTETIGNSQDHYLVEFYAPWCGHCKALAPAWKEAAKRLHGKMKLAAVDCTTNQQLASKFGVKGFPTIKFIPAKSKDIYSPEEYNGGRTAQDIVSWAETKLLSLVPPPELIQATSQDILESECYSKSICVISFLPNKLDSDAKTWEGYLRVLRNVIDTFKSRNFGWIWFEGYLNEKFEEALDVGGSGYPALVALNYNKKAFSLMRSSFSTPSISSFLNGLGSKSVSTKKFKDDLPKIKDTPKWDGKEFKKPSEEL